MTATLGYTVLTNLPWYKKGMEHDLLTAAFFSDYQIESDDHIFYRSTSEINQHVFDPKISQNIEQHARRSVEKLEKIPEIPTETLKIIKQHHGTTSGEGFNYSLTSTIGQLSKVFITCEEFSNRILKSPTSHIDVEQIATEINGLYPGDILKPYLAIIVTSFHDSESAEEEEESE